MIKTIASRGARTVTVRVLQGEAAREHSWVSSFAVFAQAWTRDRDSRRNIGGARSRERLAQLLRRHAAADARAQQH